MVLKLIWFKAWCDMPGLLMVGSVQFFTEVRVRVQSSGESRVIIGVNIISIEHEIKEGERIIPVIYNHKVPFDIGSARPGEEFSGRDIAEEIIWSPLCFVGRREINFCDIKCSRIVIDPEAAGVGIDVKARVLVFIHCD
jgi:hypothetical protein